MSSGNDHNKCGCYHAKRAILCPYLLRAVILCCRSLSLSPLPLSASSQLRPTPDQLHLCRTGCLSGVQQLQRTCAASTTPVFSFSRAAACHHILTSSSRCSVALSAKLESLQSVFLSNTIYTLPYTTTNPPRLPSHIISSRELSPIRLPALWHPSAALLFSSPIRSRSDPIILQLSQRLPRPA